MLLRYSYTTLITFSAKVSDHAFALRCVPMPTPAQRLIWQHFTVLPYCPVATSVDAFGSVVSTGFLGRRHNLFAYEAAGLVEIVEANDVRQPELFYSHPSPLTAPSPELSQVAVSLGEPGQAPEAWAMRLMGAVSSHMAYCPGITSVDTTAAQAFQLRQGVCQDFAHVSVALARLAGVPARYACGFMEGEGASHAWAELFINGRWLAIDPTNNRLVGLTYIKLAHGRDFDDCSISRGTFRGAASQCVSVSVDVWKVNQLEPDPCL